MAAFKSDASDQAPAGNVPSAVLQPGRVWRGVLGFAVLAAAGLLAVFAFGASRSVPAFPELRAGYLVLAFACAVLDVVIGAARYQIFLRVIRPGGSLWLPIRADLAGRFVAAVTPSQSGGGPAQVFVLQRGGVPVAESLSFLLINLIATLACGLAAGVGAAWLYRERVPDGAAWLLIQYGILATLALLAAMVLALLRPDLVRGPLGRLARHSGRGAWMAGTARLLLGCVEQYQVACDRFVRRNPALPFASLALTLVMYLNKFGLAWLVMRGFGIDRDFWTTVALLALIHFSVFMAPTPGGSGVAEVATGAFMSFLLPAALLGPFTLLYRMLLIYLPAIAGALVLLAEIRAWDAHAPSGAAAPST